MSPFSTLQIPIAQAMAKLLEGELNDGSGGDKSGSSGGVTVSMAPPGTETKNEHVASMDADPRATAVPGWSAAYDDTMAYSARVTECLEKQRFDGSSSTE